MSYLGNSPVLSQQEYRNIDDISGSFNGSTTSFALLVNGVAPVPAPQASNQCLISVNGVVQKPDDTGATGFRLSGGNIVFSAAPSSGQAFFGVILAGADYIYAGQNYPDGTVSAPSITFAQDLDTGFYRSGAGEVKFTANGANTVTLSSNNLTAPSFIPTSSSAPTNGVYLSAANTVAISTNGTGRLFIDSSGRLLEGTSTARTASGLSAYFQLEGTTAEAGSASIIRNGGNPYFGLFRTGSASLGSVTAVGANAGLAEIDFGASDGTTVATGAYILAANDSGSAWTTSSHPTRLAIFTTADSATSPTERVRIDSSGRVGIGTSSIGSSAQLQVGANGANIAIGGDLTANGTGRFKFITSNTVRNWQISNNDNVSGAFEITPSSTNGGTTFSTPALVIDPSSRVGIGITTTVPVSTKVLSYVASGSDASWAQCGFSVSAASGSGRTHLIGLGFSANGGTYPPAAIGAKTTNTAANEACDILFYTRSVTTDTEPSERARIDSSGRLLVGTSTSASAGDSQYSKLQVRGNTNSPNYGGILNLGAGATTPVSGSGLGVIVFTDGTGSEYGRIDCFVDATPGTNDYPGRLVFSTTADGASSPTERMRITNSGSVFIGTQSALNNEIYSFAGSQNSGGDGVLHVRNTLSSGADASPCLVLSKTATTTTSSARFIQFYANNATQAMGGIVGNGATNVQFASISDIREKENIAELTGCLDKIKQLDVVSYDWKDNRGHVEAGFIAQNVETVFPEYVVENMSDDDAEPRKGITGGMSSGYVAVLTAALQEAIGEIESLKARVAALESA